MPKNTGTPCEPISTNGWDTIYAIRFPDVNRAIAAENSSPPSFTESQSSDDGAMTATGQFNAWQLTTGGDGKNVRLILPMPTATFAFNNSTDDLKDISAIIEINLDWVDDGKLQQLTSAGATKNASVISINFGNNPISEIRQSMFRGILEKWLTEDPNVFRHTFSAVDIFDASDKDAFTWLKPRENLSYAVVDNDEGDDINESTFAVLCMTSDNDPPGTHSVSSKAIPDGVNSVMLIKPEITLKNLFLPYIHLLFDDAKDENFEIANNGMSITNNTKVHMEEQDMDGTKVKPGIDKGDFTLTIEGCKVVTGVKMKFDYGILDSMTVSVNHTSTASIGIDTSGQFYLHVDDSKTDASIEASTGLLVGSIVASIAGAIVGAAIGGLIGAAISSAGAETTTQGGTQFVLQGTQMSTVSSTTVPAATNITPQAAAQAGTQVATRAAGSTGIFATIWARMNAKIFGVVAGLVVGAALPEIPNIIAHIGSQKPKDSKTLKVFGEKALESVKWPNSSQDDYTISGLDLVESLRLNVHRKFDAPKPS